MKINARASTRNDWCLVEFCTTENMFKIVIAPVVTYKILLSFLYCFHYFHCFRHCSLFVHCSFDIVVSMSQQQEKNTSCSYRSLPWASELIWYPVVATTACLHYVTSPLGLELVMSGLVVGGFFGLILIPISFGVGIVSLLEYTQLLPSNFVWMVAQWLIIPFSIYYVVFILIFNQQHLSVKDANCCPNNRNILERASAKFLYSHQDYLQMTCVPWSSSESDDNDNDVAKLPPHKQYVIAVHPHGIHCTPLGLFSTVGSSFDVQFPGLVGCKLTGLAATIIFKIPLVREMFLNMGYVDASRTVASKVLEEGRSLFVCTGGEEESMYTTPGKDTVVLKRRKGFVRLALSYGADLVPVFGVGNNDLYTVRFITMSF